MLCSHDHASWAMQGYSTVLIRYLRRGMPAEH
jgi:hypothetical protein